LLLRMPSSKKNKLQINVHGFKWEILILPDDAYVKATNRPDTAGICYSNKRRIYLKAAEFSRALVIHELYHVYVSYLHLNSVDPNEISLKNYEEIHAEFWEIFLDVFVEQVSYVYKKGSASSAVRSARRLKQHESY